MQIHIAENIGSRQLTARWSSVAANRTSDCLTLHYNILATNCGSCPTTTTNTTVTCTDVPTDGSMCTFAVQTVVCGDIVGNMSTPFSVSLSLRSGRAKDGSKACNGTNAAMLHSSGEYM